VATAEAYQRAKFHFDPSNRLATVHQRHRQTGQTDRQRSDSIGRTVLQTVRPKPAERIEMQCGMLSPVGPENHVLGGNADAPLKSTVKHRLWGVG